MVACVRGAGVRGFGKKGGREEGRYHSEVAHCTVAPLSSDVTNFFFFGGGEVSV